MAYSPLHGRQLAHRQIGRLGGRVGAIQRNGSTIATIRCAVLDYKASERRGDLIDPLARRCLVSTYTPSGDDMLVAPDKETDKIILYVPGTTTAQSTLRMLIKPLPIEVAGTVTMWDLQVLQS